MYLLLTTYKVSPLTWWEVAASFALVFFLIYICVKIDRQLKQEQKAAEERTKRYKRSQERRKATPLPSEPIAV